MGWWEPNTETESVSAVTRFFGRPQGAWLVSALVAGGLLLATLLVPLWKMELVAPQYPEGLVMYAYGYKFADDPASRYDDIREINGLNHYIGMKPIKEVREMDLYIPGSIALALAAVAVSFVAWRRRWFQALIALAFWFFPLFFVADLQYWLYHYGHTMNPEAPLNTGSFTPKVFGTTEVWNFHSETSFGPGFYLLLAAALAITALPPAIRWAQRRLRWRVSTEREAAEPAVRVAASAGRAVVAKAVVLALALGLATLGRAGLEASAAATETPSLQERIAAAAPGDTVIVDGGVFREQVVIDKPLTLVGRNWPLIDGGGQGDVVTIAADDVTVSGFVIRGTSHSVSLEPAAVKADGADRVTLRNNRILDAHFGIHMTDSAGSTIENNVLDTGREVPVERRGHGVYLWRVTGSVVHGNVVRHAADGIHLEFSEDNGIGANVVTGSRYALHFMYSNHNRVVGNRFEDNLAGAVIMFSHDVLLKDNELSGNRKGATGAGLLLKDVDNLFAEGNRLLRNKYGMTAEGTPQSVGATAIFQRNLFALNDTGIAVMSNAPITFVENAMIDNTVQVKALGGELASRVLSTHGSGLPAGTVPDRPAEPPKGAVWTIDGRGNYWSDYRGYDANGDGVGDRPYEPQPPFAGRLERDDDLRVFQFTLAQQAIDVASDLFPLYEYRPVMTDEGPLMRPPDGLALAGGGGLNVRLLVTSTVLLMASVALGAGAAGANLRRLRGALAPPAQPLGGGSLA